MRQGIHILLNTSLAGMMFGAQGASVGPDYFMVVKQGDYNKFKTFDIKKIMNSADKDGYTPLMYAAASLSGFEDTLYPIVRDLLAAGANVKAVASDGETALTLAAEFSNHLKIAQDLIDKGADVNAQTKDLKLSALMKAATNNNVPLLKLLVTKKGINLNAQSSDGMTALMFAIHEGNVEAVNTLLAAGASSSTPDAQGNTPLIAAARVYLSAIMYDHVDITRARALMSIIDNLINRGADRKVKNALGKSFNDYASSSTAYDLSKFKIK